eukprot:scaffold91_cov127-Cylindrotheca_fusiformis.AAC.42
MGCLSISRAHQPFHTHDSPLPLSTWFVRSSCLVKVWNGEGGRTSTSQQLERIGFGSLANRPIGSTQASW